MKKCYLCEKKLKSSDDIGMGYQRTRGYEIKFDLCKDCTILVWQQAFGPFADEHIPKILDALDFFKRQRK